MQFRFLPRQRGMDTDLWVTENLKRMASAVSDAIRAVEQPAPTVQSSNRPSAGSSNLSYIATDGATVEGNGLPSNPVKLSATFISSLNTSLGSKVDKDNPTKGGTGFYNPRSVRMSYNGTTRKVTIISGGSALYKYNDYSFPDGWESPAHAAGDGAFFLYYNGTTLQWTTTPWSFFDLMIAFVYRDGVNFCLRECHGLMDPLVHEELHDIEGTYLVSGLDISGLVLNSTVAADRRPLVSAGLIKDEDNPTDIAGILVKSGYTRLQLSGATASPAFTFQDQTEIINLSTNRPYWNQFTGGAWTQTLFANNEYGKIYLLAVPTTEDVECQKNRLIFVQPQTVSTTLTTIQNVAPSSVNLGQISGAIPEFCFAGEIIVRYTGTNWVVTSFAKLAGSKKQQSTSLGNFLSSVIHDATLFGEGTSASPLALAAVGTAGTYTKVTTNSYGQVTSGASATKADVGLGNVDNTSDVNKPISTATQTALNLKSTWQAGANQVSNLCAGALNSSTAQNWTKICSWPRAAFSKKYVDFQMFRGNRGTSSFNVRIQFMQESDATLIADGNITVHSYEGLSIVGTDFALIYNTVTTEVEFWFYDTTTSNRQYVFKLMVANTLPTLYYGVSSSFPASYNSLINAFIFQPILRATSDALTGGGDTTLHYHASDRAWANITSKPTTLSGYGITDSLDTSATAQTKAGALTVQGLLWASNNLLIRGAQHRLTHHNEGAPLDEKVWQWSPVSGDLILETRKDDNSDGRYAARFFRTGQLVDNVVFYEPVEAYTYSTTRQSATPTGTTHTWNLSSGQELLLTLTSSTGDVTTTITNPVVGGTSRVVYIGHGTIARNVIIQSTGFTFWLDGASIGSTYSLGFIPAGAHRICELYWESSSVCHIKKWY